MGKRIVSAFLVWRLMLIAIVVAASFFISVNGQSIPEFFRRQGLPYWVWVWSNFDGVHYISIAKSGYFLNQQPFFPLYPFTIRYVNDILGLNHLQNGQIVSGQIVSSVAFMISLFLMGKLLILDKKEKLFGYLLAAVFLFPTAFFYTAVYNDALFLLFACMTFLWTRKRQWALASLAGALATLTRLNGLALLFLILPEYARISWEFPWSLGKLKSAFSWKEVTRSGILFAGAIPGAFIGYLISVNHWFGTWRWVFTSMSVWHQDRLVFPLQVVWRYFKILLLDRSFSFTYWVAALEFAFVLFYVVLLIYAWKRVRVSYWLFFALSILIPSLTGTFQGMPRYGLHLYPMFLILAILLAKAPKSLAYGWYVISAALQVVLLSLFSRGWFIS